MFLFWFIIIFLSLQCKQTVLLHNLKMKMEMLSEKCNFLPLKSFLDFDNICFLA